MVSEMTTDKPIAPSAELMRGSGLGLGPLARRLPPADRTLLHVLRRQVAERPDQDWLVFDGRDRLSFAAAEERALRFADRLRGEEPVGNTALLLRNQVEFMPSFLGAQLAGGVAVPLNPELRGPLLERLLERAAARQLVVAADLVPELERLDSLKDVALVIACAPPGTAPASIRGVPVVAFDEWVAAGEPTPPERLPDPWETGALVFTSGTSGGSKAAVWSHHYLYFSSACVSDALGHAPDDVLSTPLPRPPGKTVRTIVASRS
jgi:acyl-CoA synthetase (AMP-forming)/AMP-acid ligase II